MLSFSINSSRFPELRDDRPRPAVRVVIFDEDHFWGMGLEAALSHSAGINIVGRAHGEVELAEAISSLGPQVVLMRIAGLAGRIAPTRIGGGRVRVVAVGMPADNEGDLRAVAAHVDGLVGSADSPESFAEAIRVAADGHVWVNHELWGRITPGTGKAEHIDLLSKLTVREREVLTSVASGSSNEDVAKALHLGLTTVKTHISAIMRKASVCNRVQLALAAYRVGLVQ